MTDLIILIIFGIIIFGWKLFVSFLKQAATDDVKSSDSDNPWQKYLNQIKTAIIQLNEEFENKPKTVPPNQKTQPLTPTQKKPSQTKPFQKTQPKPAHKQSLKKQPALVRKRTLQNFEAEPSSRKDTQENDIEISDDNYCTNERLMFDLRQAIIWSEIIDQPIALRGSHRSV